MKPLAYRASSVNQLWKFIAIMDEIGKINLEAKKWLENIPMIKWNLVHDGNKCYGIMTTNLFEVFNSVLKCARNLLIIACV